VLASDGLWDNVSPTRVQAIVMTALGSHRGSVFKQAVDSGDIKGPSCLDESLASLMPLREEALAAGVAEKISGSTGPNVTVASSIGGVSQAATPTSLRLAELMLKAAYKDRAKDDDVTVLVCVLSPLV